ncbi:MAG: serine/threonine-protein kinase PknK [Bradymonadia bacterium]
MSDTFTTLSLGPFELHHRIGEGGMGEVWRGHHGPQQLPVAVKVLNLPRVGHQRFMRDFQGEVRAMAGLGHPGVVQIYDYGRLPHRGVGPLQGGRPFLVMEWVEGGPIRGHMAQAGWPEIKGLLLSLLDALAHAHARGLIHRDLKPENVLWGGSVQTIKLTDFGLAQAIEDEVSDRLSTGTVQGTPAYMAPEQIQGQVRDFGPWTDLYALGCMAYELVCGRPPFTGQTPVDVMVAHLTDPLPPWHPVRPVPEGLELWVRQMMCRSLHGRFRRAADAAFALNVLGDALVPVGAFESAPDLTPGVLATAPTVDIPISGGDTEVERTRVSHLVAETLPPEVGEHRPMSGPPMPRPPMPSDWRSLMIEAPSITPRGVGMALYPFRALPVIGRAEERDALWSTLKQVAEEGRPRLVLLEGASGYGKSRLAEWLCEASHHCGAATTLKASHGPLRGRRHGLGAMVARYARLQGLAPLEAFSRLEACSRALGLVEPRQWLSVGALMLPGEAAAQGVRLASPQEGWAALERWVEAMAAQRPVVVWLDDVQWGVDALGWIEHLLNRWQHRAEGRCPVLVVATARTDALHDRPRAAEMIRTLAERTMSRTISVGALESHARSALLTALLGLEGQLIDALDERTEGNPLFAVQLIGDWVRRGLLVPGPDGYALRQGADIALPSDVQEVWATRINRLLEGRATADGEALELAAVLGRIVEPGEWSSALAHLEVHPSADLVETLVEEGLAQPEEGEGWAFVHGMLRESLEARARRRGRLPALHAACAQMLAPLTGRHFRGRQGLHLLAAGRWRPALTPLAEGARAHLSVSAYREAERLIDGWFLGAQRAALGEGDPRFAEGWALRCDWLRMLGRLDEAEVWAKSIEAWLDDPAWSARRVDLLLTLGSLAKDRGDLPGAERWLEAALAHGTKSPKCLEELAWVLLGQGRTEEAAVKFSAALQGGQRGEDIQAVGRCMVGLSRVEKRGNNYQAAAQWLQSAEHQFALAGFRAGQAACLNQRGELARLMGQMDEAEACYRLAWTRYEEVGSGNAVFPQANLALALIERAAYAEARPLLEAALEAFSAQGRAQYTAALRICLLPCLLDAPEIFDAHLTIAEAALEATALADVDAARMALIAGAKALERGDRVRGLRALELSRAQWARLERPDQVTAINVLIIGGR